MAELGAVLRLELLGELHGEQTEERGELDDGVHRHAGRVLEWVADGVAHDGRVVEGGALLLELDLDDLLRVVPGSAGVRHEERLEETEEGDADEVADEEVALVEGERERSEEDRHEDVDHPGLRVLRADLDHLLRVLDARLLDLAVELDVCLDVLDRARYAPVDTACVEAPVNQ